MYLSDLVSLKVWMMNLTKYLAKSQQVRIHHPSQISTTIPTLILGFRQPKLHHFQVLPRFPPHRQCLPRHTPGALVAPQDSALAPLKPLESISSLQSNAQQLNQSPARPA